MRKFKILYADDDFASRKLLQIKLEQAGFECDTVANGLIALQMYYDHVYDLVFLDQYMPELDGEEVAARIRRISSDIPLIAITSDDSLRSRLLDNGFSAILVKPLRGDEALDIINMYL